jgi:hypothetical protein
MHLQPHALQRASAGQQYQMLAGAFLLLVVL